MRLIKKKGQEEIVGFVIIVIIVSVVLLILLSFFIRNPSSEAANNYEVESFIQSALQYTSDCEGSVEFYSTQDLIIACEEGEICLDERDSCLVLNETIKKVVENGWNIAEGSAIKGYKFSISEDIRGILLIKEGNETTNYKGAIQIIPKSGKEYIVTLNVYE